MLQTPAEVSSVEILKARRSALRVRAAPACLQCKVRKVKCTGFQPCSQCQKASRPNQCTQRSKSAQESRDPKTLSFVHESLRHLNSFQDLPTINAVPVFFNNIISSASSAKEKSIPVHHLMNTFDITGSSSIVTGENGNNVTCVMSSFDSMGSGCAVISNEESDWICPPRCWIDG